MEIYTNKNEIVLKKYSPILAIVEHAKSVAEGIFAITGRACIITDTNQVIAVSSTKLENYKGKEITQGIERAIKERKTVIATVDDGDTPIPVIREEEFEFKSQIIVPIIANGDGYGTVILVDKNQSFRFTSEDEKLVKLGASFLSKQFED